MKKGFSLIELLISLIIISLIVSSFIPIITRKIKHHNATISSGVMNCKKFDEKCMLCDKKECTLCTTQINLIDGQYVDPKTSCEVKNCSAGCAKCNNTECLACKEGFKYNATNKKCEIIICSAGQYLDKESCKTCPNGTYQEANNHQFTSCVSCPERYFCTGGKKQACSTNCKRCTSYYNCTLCDDGYVQSSGGCIKEEKKDKASCLEIHSLGICVAKFNAGDSGGLTIPTGVEIKTTISESSAVDGKEHSNLICWKGNTAASCDGKNGGYSGCNRTVCTWPAADRICSYHGWRLPTKNEAAKLYIYSENKGTDGLQLCNNFNVNKDANCQVVKQCSFAWQKQCRAYDIWSATPDSAKPSNHWFYHYNGSLSTSDTLIGKPSQAFSVRCVKDL